MKRFLIVIAALVSFSEVQAGIARWDNEANNSLWSDPLNWVGDTLPLPGDDVILDNSDYGFSYIVYLPSVASPTTVRSLTITPFPGIYISVILQIPNNPPASLVITGPGDSFLIGDGGYFQNSSLAAPGSEAVAVTGGGFLRINNGGMYVHNSVTEHAALVARLSSVPGTEEGLFSFDVPLANYEVSLAGITYGALEFTSYANGGALTYSATGTGAAIVRNDLILGDHVTLDLSIADDFIIGDTCILTTGAVFDLQAGGHNNVVKVMGALINDGTITETGSGFPELQLCGTTNQSILFTSNGIFTDSVTLHMNNASGATLESPVTVTYRLLLSAGKIKSTSANLLTIDYNATAAGGSSASFVEGPLKKVGDDDFIFPIGIGSIYAPLGISDAVNASIDNEFIAEYKRANPQSTPPFYNTPGDSLHHVSYVEHWTLEQQGNSLRNVSLNVQPESFCKDLDHTYIVRWDGFAWSRVPTGIADGPTTVGIHQTGALKTTTLQSGFLYPLIGFTLGTDLASHLNPLPINLLGFTATKMNDQQSLVTWELSECCSAAARFEVQRKNHNGQFATIAVIGGSETSRFYTYTDNQLQKGINYYRLKMIDANGSVSYSRVAALLNGSDELVISLMPTMISQSAILSVVSTDVKTLSLTIVDIQGRVMQKQQGRTTAGSATITLDMHSLSAGIYQLYIESDRGERKAIRFIKE